MAYFPNSEKTDILKSQCKRCVLKEKPCPVRAVQFAFNKEAAKIKITREILDRLVNKDYICQMFKLINKIGVCDE